MSPIYIKDRGFNSFASNMIKLSVNETKWSSLLARTGALILYISIWIFDFGPVKLPGLSRNWPLISGYLNTWFGTRKVTGTFEKRTQGPSGQSKMAAKLTKEEAEEYFTRINYTGSNEPTVEVLTELLLSGRSREGTRGPFLESPGNFTGPKSKIQIEI